MTGQLIQEVRKAHEVLKEGGVILYPTDTIWGLGCDATNQAAVEKLLRLKARDPGKSLIVLMHEGMIESYISSVPEAAWDLIETAVKPLTLVLDGGKNLAPGVMADDGSVGLRVPQDEFCQKLLGRLRKPLVSTSANFSGKPSPAAFSDIDPELIAAVDYVVNLRREEKSAARPSTIIRMKKGGVIQFLRR